MSALSRASFPASTSASSLSQPRRHFHHHTRRSRYDVVFPFLQIFQLRGLGRWGRDRRGSEPYYRGQARSHDPEIEADRSHRSQVWVPITVLWVDDNIVSQVKTPEKEGISSLQLVGGVDMVQQTIMLAKRPHIIVATPGRLMDHLSNTKEFSLRTLKYLVLDEADRLLNEDFEKSLDDILKVIPRERKTYLFSATMTKKVKKLQRACLRDPVKIEVASKYSTVDTLKQQYRFLPSQHKDCYLVYILTEKNQSTTMLQAWTGLL